MPRSPYTDDPVLNKLQLFIVEADLAAMPSNHFVPRALSSVDDALFRWDPQSVAAAAPGVVVVPVDIAASAQYLSDPSTAPGRHISVLGLGAFASVAALATSSTDTLSDGAIAYTAAPRAATWRFLRGFSGTPDGVRTVASGSSNVWIRDLAVGSPGANFQAEWYVNVGNGDDAGAGTAEDPLASLAEFLARLGQQPIDGQVGSGIVFVYINGDQLDPVTIDVRFTNDGSLAFVGTRITAVSSTIATSTPWNSTTGVIGSYSIAGVANIASHVGKMVRLNGGLNPGWKGPIAKDLGSGSFRTSWSNPADGSPVEPTVADGVNIYTVTRIGGDVRINSSLPGAAGGTVYFQDLELGTAGQDHSVVVAGGQVSILACIVHGLDVYRAVSYCSITSSLVIECRSYSEVDAMGCTFETVGGTPLSARAGGVVRVSQRCLIQGGGATAGHALEGPGHLRCAAPLACADYATAALNVFPGSTATFDDVLTMRDSASGQLAVQVFAGGQMFYASGKAPVIVGTTPTGDYKVGGTAKAKAALPYFEATNGAVVAVNQ